MLPPRTSQTHPLAIADVPAANGRIGLTLCPGKRSESLFGPPWARDLAADLDAVRAWGAAAVVTLIEDHEFDDLAVPGLGPAVAARGMEWHHVPIRDVDVPGAVALARWAEVGPRLHALLERGGRVLVHCRGGLGRAGTVAALVLIERGMPAGAAIDAVRATRPGAVETGSQERWLHARAAETADARRLRACLTGGAMGDALGADIEFLSLAAIRRRFPAGLTDLPPHQGLRGAVTDDTQMTLFTAEGLIAAAGDPAAAVPEVQAALLRWYRGQTGQAPAGPGLIADPRLRAVRAPGNTCMAALRAARPGAAARNDSKGCGTIMRVAPVALMVPREGVHALAVATSALTHGHPTGQLAAAAWAGMLADVAAGAPLEAAARAAGETAAALPGGAETAAAIRAALAAPRDGRGETAEALGGGWTAETALAIALWACLNARGVQDGLTLAVTHGGDSDSTGAVAGNMLGLMFPDETLGQPWAAAVECADRIGALTRAAFPRGGQAG